MHYDLHATHDDDNLGAEVTPENLRQQFLLVKPDFVQCDCKGHPGLSSYPTKVGHAAPGIVRDALRIHRQVTRELNIPLIVHYSGIWDDESARRHPEWTMRDPGGKIINQWEAFGMDKPGGLMCILSDYVTELLIPQLLELAVDYQVDGIWLDGENWAMHECCCPRCRAEFTRRTGIGEVPVSRTDPNWKIWRRFHQQIFVEHVTRYTDAVHAAAPDCLVCSNWMYSMRQPGPVEAPVDFLSGDFMSSFGCERAEMEGRYLDGHGLPWNLMAWGFCTPNDGIRRQVKHAEGLSQESAEVLSCGGAMLIYADPERSGHLVGWQHRIYAQVGAFVRERAPYCRDTVSIPDAVVLHSGGHLLEHGTQPFCMGEGFYPAEGALHALIENHYHVDIHDEYRLMKKIGDYNLVVVPEQDCVTPELIAVLENYVRNGGVALFTGGSMARNYPELLGVEPIGEPVRQDWFVEIDGEAATIGGTWQKVKTVDSEVYSYVMTDQEPEKDTTEFPAVTWRRLGKGVIAAIHGDCMWTYYHTHQPRLREFIGKLLRFLPVKRPFTVTAEPSIEIAWRRSRQGGTEYLHLVNRAVNPCLTPRLHLVEHVPLSQEVRIACDCKIEPRQVCLQPGRRPLEYQWKDGRLDIRVPSVHIYEIIEITKE